MLPRRRGPAYQPIGDFIYDRIEKENRAKWLWGLVGHYYEQLERCRMVEEQYHHDKKLPTQAMCQARAQIGSTLLGLFAELRQLDLVDIEREKLDLMRQKVAAVLGQFDEFEGRTLDGNRLNRDTQFGLAAPPAPQAASKPGSPPTQSAQPPKPPNPYAALDPTDRLFLRSFAEKVVIAMNLEKLAREQQPSTTQPDSPVGG